MHTAGTPAALRSCSGPGTPQWPESRLGCPGRDLALAQPHSCITRALTQFPLLSDRAHTSLPAPQAPSSVSSMWATLPSWDWLSCLRAFAAAAPPTTGRGLW